jgi:membrane protein
MMSLKSKIDKWIWDPAWQAKPFIVALPVYTLRVILAVARDLREGYLSLRATSLVYTTLLSFAPLLAISFSVLKGIGAHNQLDGFLADFLEPLGEQGQELTQRIISFVDNIQIGVLGAVGVGLLIYSVIALMHKIETAFNDIWHVANTRSMTVRVRDYLSVLLIGPLFLFLSVGMTTAMQHAALVNEWLDIDLVTATFEESFKLVPYILFGLAFAALYMFMPNTRVRAVPALIAGFVTGIVWKVLGKLFGVFVTGSASYAAIYSAFAALVLFIIWLYVGWLIVLAGASICYYVQNPSNQALSRQALRLSARVREKAALQVCTEIAEVFYEQQKGMTVPRLAAKLRMPSVVIEEITRALVDAGILALTMTKRQQEYIPGRPFDETSVVDMLLALRASDEEDVLSLESVRASEAVKGIMQRTEALMQQEMGQVTLKELAMQQIAEKQK